MEHTTNKCDACGKIIKPERVEENQTIIYFGREQHFKGELCDACRAIIEGIIHKEK